jgi:transcriptional regulator with GAF, ATPase, and Fis domain
MSPSPEDSRREPDPLEAAYEHLERIRGAVTPEAQKGSQEAAGQRSSAASDQLSTTQLRGLFRRARRATSILELHKVLETLLDLFVEMTHAERGFIMLDWQSGKVEVGRDFTDEALRGDRLAMSRTVLKDVAQTGTSVFVEDALTQQAYGSRDSIVALSLRSFYCVPMVQDGIVRGLCYTDSRRPGPSLTSEDRELMEEFAAQAAIAIENARKHEELRKDKQRLEEENRELREMVAGRHGYDQLIGESESMRRVTETLKRIESSTATVLIQGETGTGKELIARAIHAHSPRNREVLISVNCGAIPASLVESELFGAVKGAFTDARQDRVGRIASANRGTLFLDEVGELPLDVQVKLLRVLQEGEVTPVGSDTTVAVDLRVIAATNRDLESAIQKGTFREDLYYRLHVIPVDVPALRDRGTDILLLAEEFLRRYAAEADKVIPGFDDAARRWMLQYAWPGNVRQLQNAIQRAVVLGEAGRHLPVSMFADYAKDGEQVSRPRGGTLRQILDAVEAEEVQRGLSEADGVVSRAAQNLGVSRQHLHNLIRKHGLRARSSRRQD